MKNAQSAATALETAFGPVPAWETATGVSDTWSEANFWETKTFTPESRWGVRYSQSDPASVAGSTFSASARALLKPLSSVTLSSGLTPYHYAENAPASHIDPNGLFVYHESCRRDPFWSTPDLGVGLALARNISKCITYEKSKKCVGLGDKNITIHCCHNDDCGKDCSAACRRGSSGGSWPYEGFGGEGMDLCHNNWELSGTERVREIGLTIAHEWLHVCKRDWITDQNRPTPEEVVQDAFARFQNGGCGG